MMKKLAHRKGIGEGYNSKMIVSKGLSNNRVLVGIPTTGTIRAEWALARYGQVIPCNWSQGDYLHFFHTLTPIDFQVADARNLVVRSFVQEKFEWLFFIDHDVIIPPNTIIKWNDYMLQKKFPIWAGLYFTKSIPSEPLVYRGRGNSYFNQWKLGDKVWVDAVPMGNTVIHNSILRLMYADADEYTIETLAGPQKVKRVFETPADVFFDPIKKIWKKETGTEDINWCTKVLRGRYLEKAGWKDVAKRRYPFLLDTSIFGRHIDNYGIQYPNRGEEGEFIKQTKQGKATKKT